MQRLGGFRADAAAAVGGLAVPVCCGAKGTDSHQVRKQRRGAVVSALRQCGAFPQRCAAPAVPRDKHACGWGSTDPHPEQNTNSERLTQMLRNKETEATLNITEYTHGFLLNFQYSCSGEVVYHAFTSLPKSFVSSLLPC